MNVQYRDQPVAEATNASKLMTADGDIHPGRNGPKDMAPFLAQRWQDHLATYGSRLRQAYQKGPAYPKSQPYASRRDSYPPEGGRPGSSLDFMRKQLLDPNNCVLGILNATGDNGQAFQNREFGAAMCHAMNEWLIAEWTSKEPRLKASLVVPFEDTQAAVAEIERYAGNPNFVQVLMLNRTAEPPGQKRYWPIYEAAARAKLPIGIVDCYYDHNGTALCPMTTGASHHINPRGDIEPCPLIQFAVQYARFREGQRTSKFLSVGRCKLTITRQFET